MPWTDRYAWNTPRDGSYINVRLPDESERRVTFNPLKQGWQDADGKPCNDWVEWLNDD